MCWKTLVFLLFGLYLVVSAEETFSEELLLRPLPDGNILSHFHFSSRLPPVSLHGVHHRTFPKAVFQLVRKFRIREMELSFTQGRWNYDKWGVLDPVVQVAAKPVGVELSASFDVPEHEVDATWGNLTNALSGLFCASTNFLQSPTTYMQPWFTFKPRGALNSTTSSHAQEPMKRVVTGRSSAKSGTRYGALPREAVCTENLTPWLKLLPCRDKAGLTTLLDRPTIYNGLYHSLRLVIRSGDFDNSLETGTVLDQTLTVVLRDTGKLLSPSKLPDWSLANAFGSKLVGSCPLAEVSNVYLSLDKEIVKQLEPVGGEEGVEFVDNSVFWLVTVPDNIRTAESGSVLLEYQVGKHRELDVGIGWKKLVSWNPLKAPFYVSRFLAGSGNARGSLVTQFQANNVLESDEDGRGLDIMILQMVPWYVRLYGHTLKVYLDGEKVDLWSVVSLMRFTPAEDRKSPAAVELALRVPAGTQAVTLTMEYDKGFLHIDEYPPDANRGFDLPAAIVSFPEYRVSEQLDAESAQVSPLVSELQKQRLLQVYTEVLLMQLATPDFSMPYNVITLTCTVLALYFGSLLNAMRRRISEEERSSKSAESGGWLTRKMQERFKWMRGTRYVKMVKILVVVLIAVCIHQYTGS